MTETHRIIRKNQQGQVIAQSEYKVDRSEQTCPKCGNPAPLLYGDDEDQACENCYVPPKSPPRDRKEVVMPVGDEDQVGQVRGTAPIYKTQQQMLDEIKGKKHT